MSLRDTTIVDGTNDANKLVVDNFGRITVSISQLPPDEVNHTYIARYGTISSNSSTYVQLTNATAVPSGYPAQNIEYTVPTGRDFYLTGLSVALDNPTSGRTVMISMSLDGGTSKTVFFPINTDTNHFQEQPFRTAIHLTAGTQVRVYFRTSSPSAIKAFIQFFGDEY